MTRLSAAQLSLGYDGLEVLTDLSLDVPDGLVTCIVGPNGCGKSTLLRAFARLARPGRGAALLDGVAIHTMPTRSVARHLAMLPQGPVAPDGITVRELVAQGRTPHRRLVGRWSAEHEQAVVRALEATGMAHLGERLVDQLSGGQRQRAWIAMALAQETQLLLLDEPTTYLDIAHQLDVLELLGELQHEHGCTVVTVLHDLNQAARYCHHLVVMCGGRVVASGPPRQVVDRDMVRDVFGIDCRVIDDPVSGAPLVLPIGRLAGSDVTR